MSRTFGWSYPPGCSGPPDDGDERCQKCGGDPETCACLPCPTCQEPGCLKHLEDRALAQELDRLQFVAGNIEAEQRRRYALNPFRCRVCKKEMTFDEVRSEEFDAHGKCQALEWDEETAEHKKQIDAAIRDNT